VLELVVVLVARGVLVVVTAVLTGVVTGPGSLLPSSIWPSTWPSLWSPLGPSEAQAASAIVEPKSATVTIPVRRRIAAYGVIAWARRSARSMYSSVDMWVDSITTGHARPASSASRHRSAHTHH